MVSLRTIVVFSDDSMDESDEENDCMDTNTDDSERTVEVEAQSQNNKTIMTNFSLVMPFPNIFSIANFFISKLGGVIVYNNKA